jgi:hypothetical protein
MPPPELILEVLLYTVGPAALAGALVTASVCCCARVRFLALGTALACAVGVAAGLWTRTAVDTVKSDDFSLAQLGRSLPEAVTLISGASAWNRLPYVALAALVLGIPLRWPLVPALAACLVRASAAGAIAWWVVPADYQTAVWWLAPGLAAAVFAEWTLLEPLAARAPGSVLLAVAMSAFVAGGVLIHAGSARLTDAAMALGGALGGIAVAAALLRTDARGAIPGAAVLLPGLLLMGQQETFSEISWPGFALAAAAPLMLGLTWPLHLRTGASAAPLETKAATPTHAAALSRRLFVLLLHLAVMLPPWLAALYLARQAGPLEFE